MMRSNGGTPSRFKLLYAAGGPRFAIALALALILALPTPGKADGFNFIQSTYLIEMSQGSTLSNMAYSFTDMGFESANGNRIRFGKWYSTKWVDTRLGFLTQLSPEFGVIWGFSTGERAEKYKIDPSLKMGFFYTHQFSRQASFSLSASTILGGRMKERSCSADYGDIGGVQEVNCRLAASTLAPSETLNYLINQGPQNKNLIMFRFNSSF
jgi:hypothetical protein